MHGHLGIGVAGELDALVLKFSAQCGEVLDDAVVHAGELAGGVTMRVGVAISGPAMGGPPGVADPGSSPQRLGVRVDQCGFQIGQSSGPAADRQPALTVEHCQTGGVITPVLHPAQCVDHHIAGGPVPHIRHDSAHEEQG